jgi:hypothetical protein
MNSAQINSTKSDAGVPFITTRQALERYGIRSLNTMKKYFPDAIRKIGSRVLWSVEDIDRAINESHRQGF